MATVSGQGRKVSGRKTMARKYYVVATNREYANLCRTSVTRLGGKKEAVNVVEFHDWTTKGKLPAQVIKSSQNTIFVSRLADISEEATKKTKLVSGAKYLLFSEGMPVEALPSRLSRLNIRDDQRLHVARKDREVGPVVSRLVFGLSEPDRADRIVDAWVEDDAIVCLNPSFKRLSVPLKLLSKFIDEDPEAVRSFQIDEDGSFLYWEHADVHFGWEQLLQLIDPAAALAAKKKTTEFNRSYGAAVQALRKERRLRQSDIDGLDQRHLRRIEQGEQSLSTAALRSLAGAHKMSEAQYLDELAKRIE